MKYLRTITDNQRLDVLKIIISIQKKMNAFSSLYTEVGFFERNRKNRKIVQSGQNIFTLRYILLLLNDIMDNFSLGTIEEDYEIFLDEDKLTISGSCLLFPDLKYFLNSEGIKLGSLAENFILLDASKKHMTFNALPFQEEQLNTMVNVIKLELGM